MKKSRNGKVGKENIFSLKWEDLPFWLQWGAFGGIFGFLLVIIIYLGMSFNYLFITKTLLRQGAVASFIAFSAGFLHAAIFSVVMHKAGIYGKGKIKQRIALSKEELKEESAKLRIGLGAAGGIGPTR